MLHGRAESYEILGWQLAQVHRYLEPDGYFLQHDEIRVQGWDASCRKSRLTPGQLLAENLEKCAKLVKQETPANRFTSGPTCSIRCINAGKTGRYYLVQGDGPWYGFLARIGSGSNDRELELRA